MNIQLTATEPERYGRVTVNNADGSLNRIERISWDELQALNRNEITKPSCCTDEEWYSQAPGEFGRSFVDGVYEYPIGGIECRDNGSLRIRIGDNSYLYLLAEDYVGEVPNITMLAIPKQRSAVKVVALTNGQLEVR